MADKSGYPWGSNSFVVNNALAMTLAYDFTKEQKYLLGSLDALNYLLGNNAMGRSYITGWGTFASKNPHHRFWAHQELDIYPEPPPGIVVGGPNSGLQDPICADAKLDGCKPMKCYIDHIGAWSLNEITINWNAPLVWLAAFADEHAK
jgi:endoglucanase